MTFTAYASDQGVVAKSDINHKQPLIVADAAPAEQPIPTPRKALQILQAADPLIRVPTKTQRQAMLVGFAMRGKVLYGAAYDAVRAADEISLYDPASVADHFAELKVIEVKSTNRPAIGQDLAGYFFNLTTAELLVAQSLGDQYRFAFVNVVTGEFQEHDLAGVYSKARAIYPAWHIKF